MVSRIVEQQQAISAVLAEDRKNWYRMPSDSEFSVLETVVAVLKPLSTLTDALSGEKQVTISAILPVLKHIQKALAVTEGESRLAMEMKKAISNDLEGRNTSSEIQRLFGMACFLDPRFKDRHVEDKENVMSAITDECVALVPVTPTVPAIDLSESDNPPPKKKLKGLAAVLKRISDEEEPDSMPTLTPQETVESEIASYLNFPHAAPETDPLVWWKEEEGRFPTLARLARKYLCVCGTSVPSERIFSRAGYVADHHRARLTPENMDKLVFLASNMQ